MMHFETKDLLIELEKVVVELNSLDENNFDEKFPEMKKKMCELHEIVERTYYLFSEKDQEKISNASKQIKDAFDNVLKKWMIRSEEIKNELDLCISKKKILSYKRF